MPPDLIALHDTRDRFRIGLQHMIECRLKDRVAPLSVPKIFHQYHQMTLNNIWALESQMPGISKSLKNLFPSLYFGLYHLLRIAPRSADFQWELLGITSLATHLADRMVATYTKCLSPRESPFANLRRRQQKS